MPHVLRRRSAGYVCIHPRGSTASGASRKGESEILFMSRYLQLEESRLSLHHFQGRAPWASQEPPLNIWSPGCCLSSLVWHKPGTQLRAHSLANSVICEQKLLSLWISADEEWGHYWWLIYWRAWSTTALVLHRQASPGLGPSANPMVPEHNFQLSEMVKRDDF